VKWTPEAPASLENFGLLFMRLLRPFGKGLGDLPKLREIGFAANRRMLEVEKASHDCRIGPREL
jgi:hypothetical protein